MVAMVTYEDVVRAAQDVEAAGERVTVERIRRRTGGSNSTILPLLRRWRDGEAKVDQPVEEEGGDPDANLPAQVARALVAVSPAILSALAEVRAEERRSARAEVDMVRAEVVAAEQEIDAERKVAAELAAEADELRSELEDARSESAGLRQGAADLRTELKAVQAERDRLAGQVSELIEQLAQMAAAKAKVEAQVEALRVSAARADRRRSRGKVENTTAAVMGEGDGR